MTVVKVQTSLATNHPTRMVLIYPASRRRMMEQPLTPEVAAKMGDSVKAFFRATWDDSHGWVLGEKVKDRDW